MKSTYGNIYDDEYEEDDEVNSPPPVYEEEEEDEEGVVVGDPSASPSIKTTTTKKKSGLGFLQDDGVAVSEHDASKRSWLYFFFSLGGDSSAPRSDAVVIALRANKGARELANKAEKDHARAN